MGFEVSEGGCIPSACSLIPTIQPLHLCNEIQHYIPLPANSLVSSLASPEIGWRTSLTFRSSTVSVSSWTIFFPFVVQLDLLILVIMKKQKEL